MLYRLLLLVLVALGLTACIGSDDYETDIQGEVEVLPEPEPEPDGSILENGGLDSGDTSNWTINVNTGTGAAADIGVTSEQYFDGSVSLKVSISAIGSEPSDIEAGPSGVAVDSTLQYEFSAMVLGTPGAILSFMAVSVDDPGMSFGSQSIQLKSTWQKITFTFTVPEDVTSINLPSQLSYEGNDDAVMYIDAVKLIPGPRPEPDATVVEIEIPNGSFEASNSAYAPWYFNTGTGVATAAISNAQAHDGINSLEVVVTTPTASFWQMQFGQGGLDLTEGANHVFSAWIYGSAGASVRVSVQKDGDDYADLVSTGTVTLVDGWQNITLEFTGDAINELISFSFGYPENAGHTFYIDDVTMFEEVSDDSADLIIDFESDTVGSTTSYGTTGWDTSVSITEVVTLASVTGLPANSGSVNVLKVSPSNYNDVPKFSFILPAGANLANYVVKVDAYFPRSTLGLTDNADNYYKDFLLLAGAPMTGAADEGNALFHSKFGTIWDDVDVWKTYTLMPDGTKAAALTGTVEVSFGLNRPGVSGGNDYYFDNVRLELLPSVDFESDAAGSTTSYGTTGWDTSISITEVVELASVTGLPANGSSVNILKVSPSNYNDVPKFSVILPAGTSLADFVVKVDAYFPRSTLGLTDNADNYYKDFLLLAGGPMTGAADEGNPLYHSKFGTIWDDVDVWKTFTLTPDAIKGAALTGAIEISFGLNRPGVSGDNDYYFDNVRLELAPE